MEVKNDIVILGGGIVGLTIAYQIKKKNKNIKITILDKESGLGLHTSGRNSGVLHAGIYYEPNTLKAKVCIEGAQRLSNWCDEQSIKVFRCGKVITPQKECLDSQIDNLYKRGKSNGVELQIINEIEFKKLVPDGRTSSGRAIWSPNTAVVNPKEVITRLKKILVDSDVSFIFEAKVIDACLIKNQITLSDSSIISFGYLFNCTGLNADRVARQFNIGKDITLLPIKGIYWKLSPNAPFKFKTNLYPVPDLNVPFLGVHVTPNVNGEISLGPTAIPAWGRENYEGLKGIEIDMAAELIFHLSNQFINNKKGFRKYTYQQALLGIKPLFYRAAKQLIPKLKIEHLIPSNKVGIRPQLYDKYKCKLIDDFKIENKGDSTHILNAISPAFTSSFSLADLIIKRSNLNLN